MFLTEPQWRMFTDPNFGTTQDKIMAMGRIMCALGVHHGNEKTYAYAAVIATTAHGLSETQLVIDLRTLKEHVKTLREGLLEGPRIYPITIEEFQAKHPDLYAQAYPVDPPAPSKWTNNFRTMVHKLMPCRSTKAGVDKTQLLAQSPATTTATNSAARNVRLSLTSPTVLSAHTAHQPQGALPPPAHAAFSRAQTLAQWTHMGSERLALPPYEPPAAQTAGLPPAAHQHGAVPPAAQQAPPAALPPTALEPGAAGILPPAAGTALPSQLGTAGFGPPAAGTALPSQLGAAGILPPTNGTALALQSPSAAPAPANIARLTQNILERIKNRGGAKPAVAVSASSKGPTTPKPVKAMKAATPMKAMKAAKSAKPERVVWQTKPPNADPHGRAHLLQEGCHLLLHSEAKVQDHSSAARLRNGGISEMTQR